MVKKGSGWHKESKRHSEASVKGWNSRFGKKYYSYGDVKKIHSKRSIRARKVDGLKNSKLVYSNRYAQWVKNPGRFDIDGLDTKNSKLIGRGLSNISKRLPKNWKVGREYSSETTYYSTNPKYSDFYKEISVGIGMGGQKQNWYVNTFKNRIQIDAKEFNNKEEADNFALKFMGKNVD